MTVTVTLFGQARQLAGIGSRTVDLTEGASVTDAVRAATRDAPEAAQKLLFTEDGSLRQSLLVPVNGAVTDRRGGGLLKDGDDVSVFTALSGG